MTKRTGETLDKTNNKKSLTMDTKCINTIRVLSADTVEKANSGHPGAPMGCAPMAHVLYSKVMKYNPKNPSFFGRDRFVLSNGHACALLYSMLNLTGYEKPTIEDLKQFRQLGSVTAGHPENFLLEGVEVSTGPLGQGISNAVGLAMAERHLAAHFNKEGFPVVDNHTFVICGDGCLQEGVSSEASSLAGHLGLGKLIVLYDDNHITIDGNTDLSFSENVAKRYEAYGWEVLKVKNGNDKPDEILKAVEKAKTNESQPTLIQVTTEIGFGSSKAGTHGVHGAPLGAEDLANVKKLFGFDPEKKFHVEEDVRAYYEEAISRGEASEASWTELFNGYKAKHPDLAEELQRRIDGKLPSSWEDSLPSFEVGKSVASRASSGTVLNAVADSIPEIIGGSADLTPSNKSDIKSSKDFQQGAYGERNLKFGVREHGMCAILNGMAAYGCVIPYGATFLNFAGYALGAIRLAALSKFQVMYIMTHDSIGLGEDGPTHQPIEMLVSLRSIPNFYCFRPADAKEVAGSYRAALMMRNSPSLFALSRQGLETLEGTDVKSVEKGAYVIYGQPAGAKLCLVATGSEVGLCVSVAKEMKDVYVVSMPCERLFINQPVEYKKEIFVEGVPVLSVEAAGKFGWSKWSHMQIGLDTFGKSGPAKDIYNYFNITTEGVKQKAEVLMTKFGTKAPWLVDFPEA
eukprot:snap_masked-scaffold_6-processed-gene-20.18-mRNA-1 protein AED:0.06 eAED:0.06 QI:0/-1/0/1/-1/1/1/0/685